jgi:predicted metal-dependent phosphoesterase TrpH
MMKAFYDLHIHSALSPCAENEMTPNNIVNMAYIKGLDIIAVTDHNSALNCEAVLKCAKNRGIVALAGMEIETKEEVHMVCFFPGLKEALKMHDIVNNSLPRIENREDIFGQQIIMDEDDNIICNYKQMLLTAADLSIDEVFEKVGQLGGVAVPAHIDRDSYSIISNLGIIPDYRHKVLGSFERLYGKSVSK